LPNQHSSSFRPVFINAVRAHELEITALCAGALKLDDANERLRKRQRLELRLDSAVTRVDEFIRQGARPPSPAPKLEDSLRRAAEHSAQNVQLDKQHRAEALLATLNERE
jgi:hypothetical protein